MNFQLTARDLLVAFVTGAFEYIQTETELAFQEEVKCSCDQRLPVIYAVIMCTATPLHSIRGHEFSVSQWNG